MSKIIIVEDKQTIYDIAIQEYGHVDGVQLLLEDNEVLQGYDTILFAGQLLKIAQEPINKEVVEQFAKESYKPVSEVDDLEDFELDSSGGDFDLSDFDDEDFY
jgi:hypothetical protein